MTVLQKVDMTGNYLDMIQNMETQEAHAQGLLHSAPDAAIAKHAELVFFVKHLLQLQQVAEGAAPHLIDYAEKIVSNLTTHLKNEFAKEMNMILEKILWPKKSVALPLSLLEPFNTAVMRLLALQMPQLENRMDLAPGKNDSPDVLYPFEIIVRPLIQRFEYHFSGDRPTNRLDKPEYFFSHFFDILDTHLDFVSEYMQPLLLQQFHSSKLALSTAYLDATTAFISALLPIVRAHIRSIYPSISRQPALLSHLITELLRFDDTLQRDWRYDVSMGTESMPWHGLTAEILEYKDNFEHWLSIERAFAMSSYDAIEADAHAHNLDFDAATSFTNTSVPTTASLRVHDLIASVTATYRNVPSFSQRLRFFISIQIEILDRFHNRLHSALEAYTSRVSSVGRTVQGVSAEEVAELHGISGLHRLARVYGSAEYIEKSMHEWGDDVFFVDMWNQLQIQAHGLSKTEVAKDLPDVADIATKTSAILNGADDSNELEGALFDETVGSYASLRRKAEAVLKSTLTNALRDSLKPYSKNASFVASVNEESLSPSSELGSVSQMLSSTLGFLTRALATAPLKRVIREAMKSLDDFLFNRVVLAHDFSLQGAQQLDTDMRALLSTVVSALGRRIGQARLRRSEEACKLLLLPSEEAEKNHEGLEETELTLWSADQRLSVSNEEARALLADMGCVTLREAEARQILKCRLELAP